MPRRLVLTCAAAVAALAVLFGVPAWRAWRGTRVDREVVATLPDAHGLRVGDSVYFRGFGVGFVRALDVPDGRVRVRLALTRTGVPLRAGDVVRVRADGVFGGALVDLVPGAAGGAVLARRPGVPDTLAAGPYVPPDPAVVRAANETLDSLRAQWARGRR